MHTYEATAILRHTRPNRSNILPTFDKPHGVVRRSSRDAFVYPGDPIVGKRTKGSTYDRLDNPEAKERLPAYLLRFVFSNHVQSLVVKRYRVAPRAASCVPADFASSKTRWVVNRSKIARAYHALGLRGKVFPDRTMFGHATKKP